MNEQDECSGCKSSCAGCSLYKRRSTPNPENANWIKVWCRSQDDRIELRKDGEK